MATLVGDDGADEDYLFGSSSSEEDCEEDREGINLAVSVSAERARLESAAAHVLMASFLPNICRDTSTPPSPTSRPSDEYFTANFSLPFSKDLVVYRSPLLGVQEEMASRGGGRGLIALGDIYPGTLLLTERLLVPLKNPEISTTELSPLSKRPEVQLLKHIFTLGGTKALRNLSHFHPRSFVDIDPSHVEQLRKRYKGDINLLLTAGLIPTDMLQKHRVDENFLLLLMCKIHFNAFPSALYAHFAMVNHSCRPNCVKVALLHEASDISNHSELRAMEYITAGTELSISYVDDFEMPRQVRQDMLYEQFRFRCTCRLCQNKESWELLEPVAGCASKKEGAAGPSGFHTVLEQKQYFEFITLCQREGLKKFKTMKELDYLVASRDTYSTRTLETDILLARMNRFIVRVCEFLLFARKGFVKGEPLEQLPLLRTLLVALLMLRNAELVYIGPGPSYRSNETLSQIASAIHSILALGVPGRRLLDEDPEFRKWFGSDGKGATNAGIFARACDRACYDGGKLYAQTPSSKT